MTVVSIPMSTGCRTTSRCERSSSPRVPGSRRWCLRTLWRRVGQDWRWVDAHSTALRPTWHAQRADGVFRQRRDRFCVAHMRRTLKRQTALVPNASTFTRTTQQSTLARPTLVDQDGVICRTHLVVPSGQRGAHRGERGELETEASGVPTCHDARAACTVGKLLGFDLHVWVSATSAVCHANALDSCVTEMARKRRSPRSQP